MEQIIFEKDEDIVRWRVFAVNEDTVLVEFELKRNLEPADLNVINPPDPVKLGFSSKTVILSGRGPIWLYVFLSHKYHPVRALAIYDPRLGAILVASHDTNHKEGDILFPASPR